MGHDSSNDIRNSSIYHSFWSKFLRVFSCSPYSDSHDDEVIRSTAISPKVPCKTGSYPSTGSESLEAEPTPPEYNQQPLEQQQGDLPSNR